APRKSASSSSPGSTATTSRASSWAANSRHDRRPPAPMRESGVDRKAPEGRIMIIRFELPPTIERHLTNGGDFNREAKEAYLVELYRQERITHDDLGEALGLGFHETEQLLKEHGVGHDFTLEEFEAERTSLRQVRPR